MQLEPDRTPPDTNGSLQVPACIPVFALPNVVFFPRMYLPLHIFEPRYREMVADAVAGGGCVGMALLKEGWEQNYYGNPAIFDVGCVGRLVNVQKLDDGRFNILLKGLARFEVREQIFDKRYRQATIELKSGDSEVALLPAVRSELVRLLEGYLKDREEGQQWRDLFRPDVDDEVFVNGLATYLDLPPLDKQFLMEADSLPQRARRLIDLLHFKLAERDGAKGWE
jgi:Lon protease-like protein